MHPQDSIDTFEDWVRSDSTSMKLAPGGNGNVDGPITTVPGREYYWEDSKRIL